MLERVECPTSGHVDPRFCVACRSEWVGESRPPGLGELFRGLPITEPGGRWAVVRDVMEFADLLQQSIPGLEPARYLTTGVYSMLKLQARAHARGLTTLFLLCVLFSDALGLSQRAHLELPRRREREAAVGRNRCRALFVVFFIRPQHVLD